ncbi:MAG: preprotein translocase subunit YajC [Candidatus Caccovivens sp.]
MISMLLEETAQTGANNVLYYVLIAVVALLLIGMPIMMNARNKRETQKVQEQTNSLKVGDKVLTTSGVYGTIVELKFDDTKKLVVLETGERNKSYLSVDAYAIYTVFKSEAELKREAEAKAEAEKRALEEQQARKEAKKNRKKDTIEAQVAEVTASIEKNEEDK